MQENDPASSGISELANFILQSGLFAVEYYRQKVGKLGDGLTDKELVVHYLENGEKLGLRPTELFDIEWYRQENPDVIAYPAGPFAHYVANGEAEGRSPHPLFDVNYYRLTARGPIDRPLYHYIQTKGRAGPNPHPVIDTAKFLEFFAGKINDNTDPLTFIIQNREAEAFFKDLFIGRYYASQLKRGL
ncbi:hypothetical protein ACU4GA_23220 [Methylobacterium oryzae CBMB20]